MKKNVMASYLNNFKCIGGVCEDNCCIGWNVEIDKKTYAKYIKTKDKELAGLFGKYIYKNDDSYDDNVDFALVELKNNKHCPFLNQEKLCCIQVKLGENYLSNVCSSYPRIINEIDGILEYSATVSCPEIARLALGAKDGIEFEEMEASRCKDDIISINVNTKKAGSQMLVKYLQEMRGLTMDILNARKYKLWERILLIGVFFQKIQELDALNKADQIPEEILAFSQRIEHREFEDVLNALPVNQPVQLKILKDISDKFNDSNEIDSKRYISFIDEFNQGIEANNYISLYKEIYEPFMEEKEYILENYMVNYVFQSLFPAAESNQPFEAFEHLAVRYSLIKLYLIGIGGFRNGLTENLVIEFIQRFSKGLEHNYNYFEQVSNYMQKNNYNTMSYLSILIRN